MMIDKAYCIVFLSPLAGRMEIFMINVSGHLRNERRATGFEDLSTALTVNCSKQRTINKIEQQDE